MSRTGFRGAKKFHEMLTSSTPVAKNYLREQFLNPLGLKVA